MSDRVQSKISSVHGLARIHVVLAVLIIILVVIISIPTVKAYKYHGDWLLCADSLRVVNGALTVDFLENDLKSKSLTDSEDALEAILPGREDYCPAGGTVYFVRQENGTWKAICGAHDSDHAERTRLNAVYVLSQLREELPKAQLEEKIPESMEVKLNGRTYTCKLTEKDPGIRRGTSTTKGYSGTVIFYGIAGVGEFENSSAEEGTIAFFSFADEDNNANWSAENGWSGSAYGDRY